MSEDELLQERLGRLLVRHDPDVRVQSARGTWLWDFYYSGDDLIAVEMADGGLIQKLHNANKYVLATPVIESRFPRLELIESVQANRESGEFEFSYRTADGETITIKHSPDHESAES